MPVLPYNYADLEWRHSTFTQNLCGFDSIAQALQVLIDAGLVTEDHNEFCKQYMQEQAKVAAADPNQLVLYAKALKFVFVMRMLLDKTELDTPFDTIFGADAIQYVKKAESIHNDKAIKDFIAANQAAYAAHYAAFVAADPIHEDDAVTFYKYLRKHDLPLVHNTKAAFLTHILKTAYEARAMDLVYITRQLACFGHVVIHNIFPGSTQPMVSENDLFDDMALDLHLRSSPIAGGHWEGAKFAPVAALKVDKPLPPVPKPVLTRTEIIANLLSPAAATPLIFSGKIYTVRSPFPETLLAAVAAAPALSGATTEDSIRANLAQAVREVSKGQPAASQLRIALQNV